MTNSFAYQDHPLMDERTIAWLATDEARTKMPRTGLGFDPRDPDVKAKTNVCVLGGLGREDTYYRQVVGHLPTPDHPDDRTYPDDVIAFFEGRRESSQDRLLHVYGEEGYNGALALLASDQ